jgi:hypothetical protein
MVVGELVPRRSSGEELLAHRLLYPRARVGRKKVRGGREAVRSWVEPAAGLSLFSCAIGEVLFLDVTEKRCVCHPKR